MQFVGKSHVGLIARVWVVFLCQRVAPPVSLDVCACVHRMHACGIGLCTLWELSSWVFSLLLRSHLALLAKSWILGHVFSVLEGCCVKQSSAQCHL